MFWTGAALLLVQLCLAAPDSRVIPEVLDPDRAELDSGRIVLTHDGEHHRLLGDPPLLFHVDPPLDAAPGMGLEMTLRSAHPAEVDLVGFYGEGQTYVFPRRTTGGGTRWMRWELPPADRLTSFTLNLRSAAPQEAQLEAPVLRDFTPLAEAHRIEAMHDRPLALQRKGDPVRDEVLDLVVHVPEFYKAQLGARRPVVRVTDSLGNASEAAVAPVLAPERDDRERNRVLVSVELPEGWQGPLQASLVVPNATGREIALRPLEIDTSEPAGPWFEVEGRSIESMSAIIRNEEAGLFLAVGEEGVTRSGAGIPLLTEHLWLAVGDGDRWPVNEPVIRSRRDVDWMAGGQTALSVGQWGNTYHLVFTLVGADGSESLGTAQGVGTLRLVPSARNPVWSPPPRPSGRTPAWRGNALFEMNGNLALLGLEKDAARQGAVRLLLAEFPWRWINLGILPLEGLDPSAASLSGYTSDDGHFLLAGPVPQLFRSEDPLRGWSQVSFGNVPQWRDMQLIDWKGGTWLFGIEERNGGGIVRWLPVRRTDEGFAVTDMREIASGADDATD